MLATTNIFASGIFNYSSLQRDLDLKSTTAKNKELCPGGSINFLKEKNLLLFGPRISIDLTQIDGASYAEKTYCDFEIQVKKISDQKDAIFAFERITSSKNCEDKYTGGVIIEKFVFTEKETKYSLTNKLKQNRSEFDCLY